MEFSNGFLLSLSLCLDIGLANIAMITLSMQRGFTKGLWLGLGTCVGDLTYAILAMLGMAVLLQYEAVRYVLWLGGTAVLAWFCFRMIMSATTVSEGLANADVEPETSDLTLFLRGIFLAMSSPSAILWFAAVGGALIARQGSDLTSASTFLAGFVAAGVVWSISLCALAHQGGRFMGERMLRWSYIASALIFAYFTLYVVITGYMEFVAATPSLPAL
ncbi:MULTISPECIES: LysE family translocator [Pseudomonas syringae group]|uniref:LysE family translocator n=4 Tax=Pseudomonas syringae group TaxID=136849 RepID=A0AAE6QJ83_9PSED|nr:MULTISPECIES: LysE family transporter [Pseudomonas syringae group]KGS13002.1 lysine transporter LysE [Pseudomonas coronafaciens]KOP52723.1 lysine transporter LysE [Pseudomonas coronafaciens pv. porri]KOP55147.1 lysine transporter LysE [Pseudomonas coronafaciens pv. porri]KPB50692.1 Amino acid transporter LysE [Pseudomonas coronafaciens pv. oryzae]KPX29036.1 Amino acid transporter LysE [Pseudomonas coronafaciens pv. garcae]